MKKCLIMFAVLLAVLFLSIVTKNGSETEPESAHIVAENNIEAKSLVK